VGELSGDWGRGAASVPGADREVEHEPGTYEPPQLKMIGTLSELTWGTVSASDSDGVFPGSAV
jgi:hypothetical protein